MIEIEKIAMLVPEESENLIYVADPVTYELLYLNRATRKAYGVSEHEYRGMPCYKLLQGLDKPCPFCTNKWIEEDKFYIWKHYNPKLNRYFFIKDKLIDLNGKKARLEITEDITDIETLNLSLQEQIKIEETLIRCIQTLTEDDDANLAINKLLNIIGTFYNADRAYIFEIDYRTELFGNTYEWCTDQVEPQIHNLQNIPITDIDRWMIQFKNVGEFFISSLQTTLSPDSNEYQILSAQDIDSLMAAPLLKEGVIYGFIGVDNPKKFTEKIQLLKSVTYFVSSDLDKRKLLSQLWLLSYTDQLTGLGNRNQYVDLVEKLDMEPPKTLGVVFIDINGLKQANDSYGHEFGDHMIRSLGEALQSFFPDCSYRIGGDEFVSICCDINKSVFDKKVMELRKFEKDFAICEFSIGAIWNGKNIRPSEQIGYANNQMFSDKQQYYKEDSSGRLHHSGALAKEIFDAIERKQFYVNFQPKVCLETEKLIGAEALIRRKNSDGVIIPPERFIPLYENEGVVRHIDFFVIEEVCRSLHQWKREGLPLVPVAVNFSRVTLSEYNFVRKLIEFTTKYQVDPALIVIEVTESINKIDPDVLKSLTRDLKNHGFAISLDDFGSQYSSLAILTLIEFDELKFDKSLVDTIVDNDKSRMILRHMLNLCKSMNKQTVAEGIEDIKQADLLKELKCEIGQGYYFAKPMMSEDFKEYLLK